MEGIEKGSTANFIRRRADAKKNIEDLNIEELQHLLHSQEQIYNGPTRKSLPDKGERLKKKIEEIKQRISQLEHKSEPTMMETTTDLPTSPQTKEKNAKETNDIKDFVGSEIYEQVAASFEKKSDSNVDNDLEFLQTKMKYLSMKEAKSSDNSSKLKEQQLVKGKRGMKTKEKQPRNIMTLSLSESIGLSAKIRDETEAIPIINEEEAMEEEGDE